jgi:hypothetical protein
MRRRRQEIGIEAPMVISPRAGVELVRRTIRLLRGSARRAR